MQIYRLDADYNRYQTFCIVGDHPPFLDDLGRMPLADHWVPVPVAVYRGDPWHKGRPASDFTHFFWGAGQLFSRRAVEALWDLLAPYGEFLPVGCVEGVYYVYNPLVILQEAVVEEREEVVHYLIGPRVEKRRHIVSPGHVTAPIFQLPKFPNDVFVADVLAERIQASGLTGFNLVSVWEEPQHALNLVPTAAPLQAHIPDPAPLPAGVTRVEFQHPPLEEGATLYDIEEALPEMGLGPFQSALTAYVKPAIRVHTTPVTTGTVGRGCSKVGGIPDLPPGTAWPHCGEQPLWFLAQINLADVIAHPAAGPLPRLGMLSFFYDAIGESWASSPSDTSGWRVVFTEPAQPLAPAALPSSLSPEAGLGECTVEFAAVLTLPPTDSPQVTALGLSDDQEDQYLSLLRALPASYGGGPQHQLLGHADLVQCDMTWSFPEVAGGWTLLFQFDSDEAAEIMWGDGGRLYFWIPTSDLAEHRFDRVRLDLQCG